MEKTLKLVAAKVSLASPLLKRFIAWAMAGTSIWTDVGPRNALMVAEKVAIFWWIIQAFTWTTAWLLGVSTPPHTFCVLKDFIFRRQMASSWHLLWCCQESIFNKLRLIVMTARASQSTTALFIILPEPWPSKYRTLHLFSLTLKVIQRSEIIHNVSTSFYSIT